MHILRDNEKTTGARIETMTIARPARNRKAQDIKANFDGIYVEADPREYYRVLYGLDYIIPELARPVFGRIIEALEEIHGRPIRVLDVGCSYGNNAALIQFPVDIERLANRYARLQIAGVSTEELIELDRNYYRSWPRREIKFIGCDISRPAIDYAKNVGLIESGIVGNFEEIDIAPEDCELIKNVDLIISTGAIGYVTERTLRRLMQAIANPSLWVASFVLRMFPFGRIEQELRSAGMETEKLSGVTFVQRRFQSQAEYMHVLEKLDELGVDPQGKEGSGLFHAEFFLSRPAAASKRYPLDELASIEKGVGRSFGRRFRRAVDGEILLVR
jgi:SAM-dependent methyltransferase